MKAGMKTIRKQQVSDRVLWLCENSGREWATYESAIADAGSTELGHYFDNYDDAADDFCKRITAATPRTDYRDYQIELLYSYAPPRHRHSEDEEEISTDYRIVKDGTFLVRGIRSLEEARDFIDENIANPEAQF